MISFIYSRITFPSLSVTYVTLFKNWWTKMIKSLSSRLYLGVKENNNNNKKTVNNMIHGIKESDKGLKEKIRKKERGCEGV